MTNEPASATFVAAMMSAFSCLVSEISKKGLVDVQDVVSNIQATAHAHRQAGRTDMADKMHLISEHLLKTARSAPVSPRPPSSE